jgi:acetyl esterase/lipase
VVIPDFAVPPGGRPVVAWAHPTTGVARSCAPSLGQSPFESIAGVIDMIPRSYLIVATDYQGLGAPGVHPYLVGVSAARSVIDSVRAARELVGTDASSRYVVWGHSQGGHAALWTGELSHQYAPELKLEGVAAAAPASDLTALLDADLLTDGGKILTSMALVSWSKVFNLPIESVVADLPNVLTAAGGCLDSVTGALDELSAARRMSKNYLKVDPTEVEPWRGLIVENTPGRRPAGAPVLILQGTSDPLVLPKITRRFVKSMCRNGDTVNYVTLQGVDHGLAARKGASRAVAWITDRFYGKPAQSNCGG